MKVSVLNKVKSWFTKSPSKQKEKRDPLYRVSIYSIEKKFEAEDLVGAARDLKGLLEYYGRRKKKNHRNKGREFIHFILSNKHKDLKSIGYKHWQNINSIIQNNYQKVYPYHKQNLREAMDFYEKEIRSLKTMYYDVY